MDSNIICRYVYEYLLWKGRTSCLGTLARLRIHESLPRAWEILRGTCEQKKAVAWQELTCGKTAGNLMSDFFSKILVSVIVKLFQFLKKCLKFSVSLRALLY